MPYHWIETWGSVSVYRATGKIKKSEMDDMQKHALAGILQQGKACFLLLLEDFEGWDKSDDWGGVSFQEYDPYIDKIAVVGEKKWEDPVSDFTGKGLRPVEIRYFLPTELGLAQAWIGLAPDPALGK